MSRLAQQTGITTVGDAQLIEAYRDREDASAYSELVRRHQIAVYRLLTGLLLDPDAAEPACEDVFVRAAHRLHELSDPTRLEEWLLELAQELARERHDQAPPVSQRVPLDASLGAAQGKEVMRGAVREVLAGLPSEQRSVLILAELHGEPVDRIARTLGQPPRVIRERLAAARKGFVKALTVQRERTAARRVAKADAAPPAVAVRADVAPPASGAVVPGYRMGQMLGEGGMGQVYLAEHVQSGRSVALKLLLPEHIRMLDMRERFQREALAMSVVQHPNLVELFESGETTDGGMFLAMEWLQGSELFDLLLQGPLPPAQALRVLQHVLHALGQLHARGIVHRDVKPENVFMVEHEHDPSFAKLIDLGIAQLPPSLVREATDVRLTHVGIALGTPAYIAPEQVVGNQIDGRADLYAASVMLFEMLTGRLPFESADAGSMLAMHVSVKPPRLRDVAPQVAGAETIEPLLERGLAKDAEDRFADAEQYLAAVQTVVAALG